MVQHCHDLYASSKQDPTVSTLQYKVEAALRRLGYTVEVEKPILGGLRHVDLVVNLRNGVSVGVEVDGPWHYLGDVSGSTECKLSASTRLRNRIMRRALMRLAPHSELPSLPFSHYLTLSYHEWNACGGDHHRENLLLDALLRRFGHIKTNLDEMTR